MCVPTNCNIRGQMRARNIMEKEGMFYVMDVVDAVNKAREAEEKANQAENENKPDKSEAPQIQAGQKLLWHTRIPQIKLIFFINRLTVENTERWTMKWRNRRVAVSVDW